MNDMYTVIFHNKYTGKTITMKAVNKDTIVSIKNSFTKKEMLVQNFVPDNGNYKTVINLDDIFYIEFKKD